MLANFVFNSVTVRVVMRDGEPWWVAKDVAEVLGYADPSKMTNHVDSDDKIVVNPQDYTDLVGSLLEYTFRLVLINESGLYACIFGSKKPVAKVFKRWVTTEVLPSIRKYGMFQQSKTPLDFIKETMDNAKQQLYIIKNEITGKIKIGVSNNVSTRIRQLECASGCSLKLLYTLPYSDNVFEIEQYLHKKFENYRSIGEWFTVDVRDVINEAENQALLYNENQIEQVQENVNTIQEVFNSLWKPSLLTNEQYEELFELILRVGDSEPAWVTEWLMGKLETELNIVRIQNAIPLPNASLEKVKESVNEYFSYN